MKARDHVKVEDMLPIIRNCFNAVVSDKHARIGGKHYDARKSSWDWQAICNFIVENELSMTEWVHFVVFDQPVPRPSHLRSKIILERFLVSRESLRAEAKNAMKIQLDSNRKLASDLLERLIEADAEGDISMSRDEIIACVIGDESNDLCPLFRFCWAVADATKMIKAFESQAISQYLVYPQIYDEVWGDFIPKKFKVKMKLFS